MSAAGDFHRDALPSGADVVSLVRVLHDHNDAAALALLRSVRRALPDDGALLLAEPMAETPGAEPAGAAYFGFYLLAMGSGRPRRQAELTQLLQDSGFTDISPLRSARPMFASLLTGRRV